MKMQKKETQGDGIAYARKESYEYDGKQYEADIQHGDIVEIKDEGIVEEHPQWGESHKFVVDTRNGDKRVTFNQSSINACIEKFGDESSEWKGKKVKIWTRKDVIGGRKVIVAYTLPSGFILDEFGDVVQTDRPPVPRDEAVAPATTTRPDYDEDLTEADVPF